MACALGKVAKQLGVEGKDASPASPCKLTSFLNNAVAMRNKTWKIPSRHIPTPSSLLPSHLGWQNQVKSMDLMTVSLTPFFFTKNFESDPRWSKMLSSLAFFFSSSFSSSLSFFSDFSGSSSFSSFSSFFSLPRYPPSGKADPCWPLLISGTNRIIKKSINWMEWSYWAIHVIPPARPTAWKTSNHEKNPGCESFVYLYLVCHVV